MYVRGSRKEIVRKKNDGKKTEKDIQEQIEIAMHRDRVKE